MDVWAPTKEAWDRMTPEEKSRFMEKWQPVPDDYQKYVQDMSPDSPPDPTGRPPIDYEAITRSFA